jgi:Ca-activated chloride channel family protein
MLWLLAITVPVLSLFLWWSWRKRQVLIAQFVQSRLLAHLTVGLSRPIQKARMILLVLATGLLILTLAEPEWGFAWEQAKQRGLDIVVAIDTSRSMLAEDIAPNRLQRAKLAALDLMKLAHRDRLGLVAFAGTAFLQCPLTLDDEAFRQSVNQLDVGIIPQGGTALAEAIQTAETAYKEEGENHRVLILFTDGEDHDSGALEAAQKAASAGLRIFTIGVGTPNGELLRQKDDKGNLTYIKDEDGNVVKSRLNERLLTQIATAASGFYMALSGANTMERLYASGLAPLPKSEIKTKLIKQYHERFQWPLGLAILLLLLEVFLPDRKKIPRSEAIIQAANPELRQLVTALAVLAFAINARASNSSALHDYESGHFKDAHQEYLRLLERRPDDPKLQYNTGAAAYQAKNFDEAEKHFSKAATAPDLNLQESAYYNLGNARYRLGQEAPEVSKKQQAWEQAVRDFEAALKLNPKDADADFNLKFVKDQLEKLKQQQQQQQSKDSKDQNQKDQDKKNQDQQKQDQKQQQSEDKSKDSESKQDQQSQPKLQPDQQSQDQKDKEQQNGKPKPKDEKQDQQNQDASSRNKESEHNSETNATQSAASAIPGQMTPEQVKQLLDSQKNNEKMMIFLPPDKLKNRKPVFKDW